jgi:hypothetical protein
MNEREATYFQAGWKGGSVRPWPCDTALIFLPELDDTPLPNLRPDLDSPW